ncbi:MAG: hypothetical protein M0024_06115 [Nitrospiraceae bacterium]|nr:hypothetical protein [Nitrospiraceae bacterium]
MLATVTKQEYVNDFLYFVVKPENRDGKDVLIMCSGINLDKFAPITRGRYGIGGNPVRGGLQLVKYDICALALSRGATPRDIWGYHCDGIAPTKDAWYSEPLQIENAGDLTPEEIIALGVTTMVRKIVACSGLGIDAPGQLQSPAELQAYLDTLCRAMPC